MAEPRQGKWYVQFAEGEEGPLTSQNLRDLAGAGRIRPDTPIRKEGMVKAVPASKVRGLLPQTPQTFITEDQPRADAVHSTLQPPEEDIRTNSPSDANVETSDKGTSTENLFSIAEEAALKEDFQTALDNYSLFIEMEVSNNSLLQIAHTNRGLILIHLKSIEDGKKDLLRAVELGSDKAKHIHDELFSKYSSSETINKNTFTEDYSKPLDNIYDEGGSKDHSVNVRYRSLWILILGFIVNLSLYVVSSLGKGADFYFYLRQLATVVVMTGISYGIVSFFAWLVKRLTKQSLPPVHRAVLCSAVCTLIILGTLFEHHIHGRY